MKPISEQFDRIASQYDSQRRKLIPCFDDFYTIAASLAVTNHPAPRLLDLGAGTGLFSSLMLEKYPQSELHLIDLSVGMLDIAKLRFSEIDANITYTIADYSSFAFHGTFDCIFSSLSIHHLEDAAKQALYRTVYQHLKPGGVFVNADQVLGSTPYLDDLNRSDWRTKIEATNLSEAELQAAYERTKLDKMAPLDEQLAWLRQSGFADVDCVYKSYNFVVMFGRRKP